MLNILGPSRKASCDGMSRRDFIRPGTSGLGATGLGPILLLENADDTAGSDGEATSAGESSGDSGGGAGNGEEGDGDGDGEPPSIASLKGDASYRENDCSIVVILILALVFSLMLPADHRFLSLLCLIVIPYAPSLPSILRAWSEALPSFVSLMDDCRIIFPAAIRERYYDPGRQEISSEMEDVDTNAPLPRRIWHGFWWRFRFGCLLVVCFWKWIFRPVSKAIKDVIK